MTDKTGDFRSLRGKTGPAGRGAAQITFLNTKPWWWICQMGQQIDCFTRIEGASKVRCLVICGWNTHL